MMDQVDVMVFLEKRETEVFPESPCLDVKDESVTLVVKDSLEMLVLPEARYKHMTYFRGYLNQLCLY